METAFFEGASQHYQTGDIEPFVTVLYPVERGADAQAIADRFSMIRADGRAVGLAVDRAGNREVIGVKLDYEADLLMEDIRPRYTVESSLVEYGDIQTDADFFHFVSGPEPKYAATHLAFFANGENVLFEAPESQFFQVWGRSDLKGRAKWRRWDNWR